MLFQLMQSSGQLGLLDILLLFLGYLVVVFISLPMHELVRSFVAVKLGDDTPRWHGGLRFDPISSIDPWGAIMLFLFGLGFSRPSPINPRNFRNPKRDMALTALAGILTYIGLAAVSIGLFRLLLLLPVSVTVGSAARFLLVDVFASVNISLAVFHLLPLPPLSGWRVLSAFLPDHWVYTVERYSRQITLCVMLLLFVGALDVPLSYLRVLLLSALLKLFGF